MTPEAALRAQATRSESISPEEWGRRADAVGLPRREINPVSRLLRGSAETRHSRPMRKLWGSDLPSLVAFAIQPAVVSPI